MQLSKEELIEMENYTVYGVMILDASSFGEMARQIATSHYEN